MGRRTIRGEVKIPCNFKLTPTTITYLDYLAKEQCLSRAEVLERIIDHLRNNNPPL